jgi:nucleotide-binding universal stress UspA family protein
MRYRTMLVHVDNDAAALARIDTAIALARQHDACLVGLSLSGISRALLTSMPPEETDPTLALHLGYVREPANAALAQFSARCQAAQLSNYEARLVDDEAASGLSLHAGVADLTILSQADPQHSALDNLPAQVVTQAGGPVLVLPFGAAGLRGEMPGNVGGNDSGRIGQQVVVAWDASREAARALHSALPLLGMARQVTLVTVDTAPPGHASADARSADPLPWLARHGIIATHVMHTMNAPKLGQRRHPIGETLLSLCGDTGADLLVMGAYAHSRLRETLLGGVTRTILEKMTVPVLMAH